MTRLLRAIFLAGALSVGLWLAPAGSAPGPSAASAQEHAATGAARDDHAAAAHAPPGPIPSVKAGVAPMVTALLVFVIVLVVLSRTAWPKISAGLAQRERKIREEILAAEAARRQARDALEQYEKSLAEARAEAQKMLEQARAQQQMLAGELKAKADVELTAMKERARRDIEAAKRAAISEIYEKSAEMAGLMATKILKREVGAADQRRLLQETVTELETVKP
ncbi:MAG: F0F1 ATP synthase subunit B [Phycisphaerales bacterium]